MKLSDHRLPVEFLVRMMGGPCRCCAPVHLDLGSNRYLEARDRAPGKHVIYRSRSLERGRAWVN